MYSVINARSRNGFGTDIPKKINDDGFELNTQCPRKLKTVFLPLTQYRGKFEIVFIPVTQLYQTIFDRFKSRILESRKINTRNV